MKKIFLKLFVFALLLSFFVPMLGTAAEGKSNPVNLNWRLQRDVGGVKIYVALLERAADLSSSARSSNLWAFWRVINESGQEIQLNINNRVYKTSEGETRPKNNLTIYLKPGEATEGEFLSHLRMTDHVSNNPKVKVNAIEFIAEAKNRRTGEPLTPAPQSAGISGTYQIALVSANDGTKPNSNFATVVITDDGKNITSNWFHKVTSYNRQTGELAATGGTYSGGRPSELRLKFTISGTNVTAVGSETRYFKGSTGVYQVRLTRISQGKG